MINNIYSQPRATHSNISQREFDSEQEAIIMIQSQNKKIQDLFMELERKEAKIQNLLAQINTMESYKIQMENFKSQVGILEEKLKLYEGEFSNKNIFLNEQLKHVSDAENKFRHLVVSKDKIILEMESLLKEQEMQIVGFKKQLLEKDRLCEDYKHDLNGISQKLKNMQIQYNQKDEEFKKSREEFGLKFSENTKEKTHIEEKLAQLITIVKQYSNELADLNNHILYLENENKSLVKGNNKFKQEIEECYRKNKELLDDLAELKIVKKKLLEAENYLNDLEESLTNEKARNESLSKQNSDLNEKLNKVLEKYSGENSLENLRGVIESKQNEIFNLKQTLENLAKLSKAVDNKFCEVDAENKEILQGINGEFKAICQWIDTYLSSYYEYSYEIPDLPYTNSKFIKNKTKIEALKETLNRAREKSNKEFFRYENCVKDLKNEQCELLSKQERLNYEISDLKTEILKKNEEIFKLKQAFEQMNQNMALADDNQNKANSDFIEKQENYFKFIQKLSDTIKEEFERVYRSELLKPFFNFILQNKFSNKYENLENQIEDELEKLLQFTKALVKEYENSNIKLEEIQKLKKENDKQRKDMFENSKSFKEEMDKIIKEKEDALNNLEKVRLEQIKIHDNNSKSSMEKMRIKSLEKEELIMQLEQENNLLKSQLDIMEKNLNNFQNSRKESEIDFKEKSQKLNESFKMLEKKYKNLLTDIELKNMQIDSHEKLLNRKNLEIQEYKSKLENHLINAPGEIRDFEKEKFKQLEVTKFFEDLL